MDALDASLHRPIPAERYPHGVRLAGYRKHLSYFALVIVDAVTQLPWGRDG